MFELVDYDINKENDKYVIKISLENKTDKEIEAKLVLEDSIFELCNRDTKIKFSTDCIHWMTWDLIQDNAHNETRGLQMQALWGSRLKLYVENELIQTFDLKYTFTNLRLRQGINKFSAFKKKKFWIIGDSHAGYYTNTKSTDYLTTKNYDIVPMSIMGLTLHKLINSNWSKWLETLPIFEDDIVCLDIGEIDLRCSLFDVSQKKGIDLELLLNNLLTQYFDFLLKLKERYKNKLVVLAPNRPIKDGCLTGNVRYYKLDISNQNERVELWKEFNSQVEGFCQENSINYWDIKNMYTDRDGTLFNEVLYYNDIHINKKEPMLFNLKQKIELKYD